MTEDFARRTATISLPVAVLILALGCGVDSPSAPTQDITPTPAPGPAPAPLPVRYHVSGIVIDDNGSPIANAEVAVENLRGYKQATTSTSAGGYYEMVFETGTPAVVHLIHAGGGDYEHYYVQALPWGTAEIVKNLRLRRIRTFEAGQSIDISIEPDSSLAYDGEDWWAFDKVWERLHVRVADAGTLTIDARPEAGDIHPSLAVFCLRHVTDNCLFDWVKAPAGSGIASLSVQANSLFELRVAIPSRMAPQRYKVATSLQR
jgi:hypothetical protein